MGGNVKVHRLVYELYNNESVKGLVVRHTCDNPKCINPLHLLKGTPLDNIKDRDERGRTYKVINKEIVLRVKELLSTGKLSQKEISILSGIDQRRVSDINCGRYSDEGKLIRR
jgi:predicted XRE-type DNA-binding protein